MNIISKWGKKLFQSGEASTTFYFKVGQKLFQNEVETVIWKWVTVYFKVEQKLFQSWAITSKWDKMLFQIRAVISTWVNYFEKGNHFSSLTKYFMHFSSHFILWEKVISINVIFFIAIEFISYARFLNLLYLTLAFNELLGAWNIRLFLVNDTVYSFKRGSFAYKYLTVCI